MSSGILENAEDVSKVMEDAAAKLRALLAAVPAGEEVMLSKELAELLRWRGLTWNKLPKPVIPLVLPFLTLKETLSLDTALSERGEEDERDHLQKAYVNLRSAGFNEWVFKSKNDFEGLRWARKRGIDLRHLKLEYKGETDRDKVLMWLVHSKNEDLATYYAVRSDAKDVKDGNTLRKALEHGYLTVVQCILERGTETVNKSDIIGMTPLYMASEKGYLEVVKTLLAAKAEVNKSNHIGQTPLHIASKKGYLEVVKALLAAKAEVDKSNTYGWTPLYMASWNGHLEVVKTLLAAKAEVNKSIIHGGTPLLLASEEGHLEVVKTLLAAKAEVNKSNNIGRTPLHLASKKGHLEVVKALFAAKAEVNKSTNYGETPLAMARSWNHHEVAAVLREAGGHE